MLKILLHFRGFFLLDYEMSKMKMRNVCVNFFKSNPLICGYCPLSVCVSEVQVDKIHTVSSIAKSAKNRQQFKKTSTVKNRKFLKLQHTDARDDCPNLTIILRGIIQISKVYMRETNYVRIHGQFLSWSRLLRLPLPRDAGGNGRSSSRSQSCDHLTRDPTIFS